MPRHRRLPVPLYVPNLLCYARIVLAFVGLHYATTQRAPVLAVGLWIVAMSLDLVDGLAARMLQQTSSLGAFLDICADNVLRTTIWTAVSIVAAEKAADMEPPSSIAAAIEPSVVRSLISAVSLAPLACSWFICLEWTTMVCTQIHAAANNVHWKAARARDPWLIRAFFQNNFVNVLGGLGMFGLFGANLLAYGSYFPVIYNSIPYYNAVMALSFAGRLLAMFVELWLCCSSLSLLVEADARNRDSDAVAR
jgi:CDP-alcohol phosphatidyltransferase